MKIVTANSHNLAAHAVRIHTASCIGTRTLQVNFPQFFVRSNEAKLKCRRRCASLYLVFALSEKSLALCAFLMRWTQKNRKQSNSKLAKRLDRAIQSKVWFMESFIFLSKKKFVIYLYSVVYCITACRNESGTHHGEWKEEKKFMQKYAKIWLRMQRVFSDSSLHLAHLWIDTTPTKRSKN